jgi:hypothetical protein
MHHATAYFISSFSKEDSSQSSAFVSKHTYMLALISLDCLSASWQNV